MIRGLGFAVRHQFGDNLQAILLRHPEIEDENIGSKLIVEYNLDRLVEYGTEAIPGRGTFRQA